MTLAIIGGSGLTQLASLGMTHRKAVRTPYGEPSGALTFGRLRDREVIFLARHGYGHTVTPETTAHCGSCTACLDACPTGAIVGPYELDARRCISYLTIELKGAIPDDLKPAIGNRVYGCDDCQLVCPWNKFAQSAALPDFAEVRNSLDDARLVDLFAWTREQFEQRMEGSAIRRIGYDKWLSNVAVALGNAPPSPEIVAALQAREDDASPLVRDAVAWALKRHRTAA